MKLSLTSILETSRWKTEGHKEPQKVIDFLRALPKGFWVHFTNNPKKISFNPSTEDKMNPIGIYGHPVELVLINERNYKLLYDNRKYVVIFKPKEGSNIVDFAKFSEYVSKKYPKIFSSRLAGPKLTKLALKLGIDGFYSKSNIMSRDVEEEIVVFSPKNIKVVGIFPNTIKIEKEIENIENKLKNIEHYKKYSDMKMPTNYMDEKSFNTEYSRFLKGREYDNYRAAINDLKKVHRSIRKLYKKNMF